MNTPTQKIIPFFTFSGNALDAMNYYISFFKDAKIISTTFFEENQRGEVGKVMNGTFEIMGLTFMVMDMQKEYAPEFSWATTMLLHFDSEEEFDHIFENLSNDGVIMMGPEPVMDLRKVAWVTDKFNVTWQLIFK